MKNTTSIGSEWRRYRASGPHWLTDGILIARVDGFGKTYEKDIGKRKLFTRPTVVHELFCSLLKIEDGTRRGLGILEVSDTCFDEFQQAMKRNGCPELPVFAAFWKRETPHRTDYDVEVIPEVLAKGLLDVGNRYEVIKQIPYFRAIQDKRMYNKATEMLRDGVPDSLAKLAQEYYAKYGKTDGMKAWLMRRRKDIIFHEREVGPWLADPLFGLVESRARLGRIPLEVSV